MFYNHFFRFQQFFSFVPWDNVNYECRERLFIEKVSPVVTILVTIFVVVAIISIVFILIPIYFVTFPVCSELVAE